MAWRYARHGLVDGRRVRLVRAREWDSVDWPALKAKIAEWAAGHPDGTVADAITALNPRYPGDKDTVWFFGIELRDARWARDLAALREFAPEYQITAVSGVRFTIRRDDGTGGTLETGRTGHARELIEADRAEARTQHLAELRWEFPEYQIDAGTAGFTARRRDGTSGTITAKTKAEMRDLAEAPVDRQHASRQRAVWLSCRDAWS